MLAAWCPCHGCLDPPAQSSEPPTARAPLPARRTYEKFVKDAMNPKAKVVSLDDKDILTVASALKHYLRGLPEPLLTFRFYSNFLAGGGEWPPCLVHRCGALTCVPTAFSSALARHMTSGLLLCLLHATRRSLRCSSVPRNPGAFGQSLTTKRWHSKR